MMLAIQSVIYNAYTRLLLQFVFSGYCGVLCLYGKSQVLIL
jgi:hypothetical protein